MAVEHEKALFSQALIDNGQSILREVENVATSDDAVSHIRTSFDREWAEQHVAAPLERNFNYDYVLILDGNDQPLLSSAGHFPDGASWVSRGERRSHRAARLYARPRAKSARRDSSG